MNSNVTNVRLRLKRTHRQIDLGWHAVELQVKRVLGAGQSREASGPVRRQRSIFGTGNHPVNTKDSKGILSKAAAVLH